MKHLESIRWYLWHGNTFQALDKLQGLVMDVESAAFETRHETARKLLKEIEELHTYVDRNQEFVPNYGERYRNSERIATGFVESAVNQVVSKRMVKQQQMGWSQRGAHLLLQIRTRVLNEEWENTFRTWYPAFRPKVESDLKKAAEPNPQESPALVDKHKQLTLKPMARTDVLRMIKRRALLAGLPYSTCCHTFRATGATGIAAYLENGGTIEKAQAIANHESPRTTKLYDRTSDAISLDEVERIAI
jgi:hypothetical protein